MKKEKKGGKFIGSAQAPGYAQESAKQDAKKVKAGEPGKC